jgi:predicted permease
MANGGVVTPLLGALQACVSVLLTMSYGVAAQRLRLIQESSINDMAGLGVKLFLPALIVINLGEQLQLGNALNYLPVLGIAPFSIRSTSYKTVDKIFVNQSGPSSTPAPQSDWHTSHLQD